MVLEGGAQRLGLKAPGKQQRMWNRITLFTLFNGMQLCDLRLCGLYTALHAFRGRLGQRESR